MDRVHRLLRVYTVLFFLVYLALGIAAVSNLSVIYYSPDNFHLKTGLNSAQDFMAYVRYGLLLASLILVITMLIQELLKGIIRRWAIVSFALLNLGMFALMTNLDTRVLLLFTVTFAPIGFYVWRQLINQPQ